MLGFMSKKLKTIEILKERKFEEVRKWGVQMAVCLKGEMEKEKSL